MHIEQATQVTDELVEAFAALVPQLSSAQAPGRKELEEIVSSPATILFLARDDEEKDRIIGSLTLVVFRIPTGMRAWIEDVVVDGKVRGKGAGEALTRAALEYAAAHGCRTVDLTSRPSRVAANRLYQKVGFVSRETNLYRYTLEK